jgi:hypothetical protein
MSRPYVGRDSSVRWWTDADLYELRKQWGLEPARCIAERLGRTTNSIIGKARKLGLPEIPRDKKSAWIRAGYAEAIEFAHAQRKITHRGRV